MRIWKNWDEEEKAVAVKLTGAFFLVAAIFVFISIVSYLSVGSRTQACFREVVSWKMRPMLRAVSDSGPDIFW